MEGDAKENGRPSDGRESTNSRPSGRRIKHFPQGFSKHSGIGTVGDGSESSEIRESIGSGELPQRREASSPINVEGNRRYSVGIDGVAEFSSRPSEQSNRGVRNSASNHSNNATKQGERTRNKIPRRGTSPQKHVRELLQEFVKEDEQTVSIETSDAPVSSILDLDTKSSINLSNDVEIVPTRMMEREIIKNQETVEYPVPESMNEWGEIDSPSPTKKKPGKPKKSNGKSNVIKTDKADTTVIPAKPYKFEKETREQLREVIQLSSKLMDMGIDYGLGIDTELVPLWELNEDEAETFVRILERRAARSETVRDKIVPKMLEGRDYIEAGMIVAPRAVATVKAIVENGGVKPHLPGKGGAGGNA